MEGQGPHRRRGLRARVSVLLALAVLAGGSLGVPVAAGEGIEGGNSFNELSKKAQEEENTETTTAPKSGTESEAHNSNTTIFIGAGAAILLLLAIAYVIVKDARKVAPAGAEDIIEGRGQDRTVRHQKRRAKAKAAKTQRKKNR